MSSVLRKIFRTMGYTATPTGCGGPPPVHGVTSFASEAGRVLKCKMGTDTHPDFDLTNNTGDKVIELGRKPKRSGD